MLNNIFDSHAHYNDNAFDADRDTLLSALPSMGVSGVINCGTDAETSLASQKLAEKYDYVYFAAGIHPEDCGDKKPEDIELIRSMLSHNKCVAIGEIGLDHYWPEPPRETQLLFFEAQLKLAADTQMPVIIHDREAHGDCFEIISRHKENRGVFHCYSGSAEMASELLKMGWYLGFDGPITYKNARKAVEVLSLTPLDRILIETDSPYLSPVPLRGKRNDSRNLRFVAEKIAEIKGLSAEEIASATSQNAKKLFRL